MNPETRTAIILATLEQINLAYQSGRTNALTSTRGGEVNPDAAYIELVRELLALAK